LPFGGLLEAAVEVATTLELGAERVEPATRKEMKNLKRGFEFLKACF
jgi:hypothetical protein